MASTNPPRCDRCKGPTRWLFQLEYTCPRCDGGVHEKFDLSDTEFDDEPTQEIRRCPECSSTEVEEFPLMFGVAHHCLPCGKVFVKTGVP